MFPWFLCFFPTPAERALPVFRAESSLWWNPTETVRDFTEFNIVEGDMLIPDSDDSNLKNALKSKRYLWENGRIFYEFGDNFTCSEKNLILDSMRVLERKTCIKFIENDNQNTFIRFQKENNGCYAPVGRLLGMGPLPVNLQAPECFKEQGIIEHELLHVAGLFHEQSRPDRDEYVTIHWCNIQPLREKEFLKRNSLEVTTFDLPYDYYSVMHYPKWAFSRNGKPTITAKDDPDMSLGQRKGPSPNDFEKVNKMYSCKTSEEMDNSISDEEDGAGEKENNSENTSCK